MRDLFDELLEEARRRQAGDGGEPAEDTEDSEHGEPPPPRRPVAFDGPRPRRSRGSGNPSRRTWIVVVAVLAVVLFGSSAVDLWTEAIWFGSVGFSGVFSTRLGVSLALFLGAGMLAAYSPTEKRVAA